MLSFILIIKTSFRNKYLQKMVVSLTSVVTDVIRPPHWVFTIIPLLFENGEISVTILG